MDTPAKNIFDSSIKDPMYERNTDVLPVALARIFYNCCKKFSINTDLGKFCTSACVNGNKATG